MDTVDVLSKETVESKTELRAGKNSQNCWLLTPAFREGREPYSFFCVWKSTERPAANTKVRKSTSIPGFCVPEPCTGTAHSRGKTCGSDVSEHLVFARSPYDEIPSHIISTNRCTVLVLFPSSFHTQLRTGWKLEMVKKMDGLPSTSASGNSLGEKMSVRKPVKVVPWSAGSNRKMLGTPSECP